MDLITPYARIWPLVTPKFGVELLRKVEAIGRVSHRSEEAQTADSWKRFIEAVVLGHGDWSITEHAVITVEAYVDRGITHEWVRHRLGAYTQESTRFVNYQKKQPPAFVRPKGLTEDQELVWQRAIIDAETAYLQLVTDGVAPQLARSVFPTGLASKLVVTYNLRMWRHFFIMRTTREAHPQMRQVTIPLLDEFKRTVPLLYDDINPEARQVDNLRLPR